MEDEVSGPVILISKFNVEPKDVNHFFENMGRYMQIDKTNPYSDDLFYHKMKLS
ncbi:MAG: hypothetical protein WB511_14300 [Nitrososphaeraceae archaeon]